MSTQTKESRSAHFNQHKQLSLQQNRLTMHKKSSIDCKLFAINDLAGHPPACLKNGHSCSDCRHRPACLKTVQAAGFSSPRCLLFAVDAFDGSQGAYSPRFHREFANSVALTTSSAVRPTSLSIYFSKPKKLDQGKEPENGMLNRHKKTCSGTAPLEPRQQATKTQRLPMEQNTSIFLAAKLSHLPRMKEFNAGVQTCLKGSVTLPGHPCSMGDLPTTPY